MARVSFNYQQLKDSAVAKQAQQSAKEIQNLLAKSGESVVQIGRLMALVKDIMSPAMYRAWLECEFAWTDSVSYNYIQAFKTFGELDCLKQFQPTAIINLSRKKIPESVVKAAIEKARAGDWVTFSVVRQMLNDAGHKPQKNVGRKPNPKSPRSIVHSAIVNVEQLTESLNSLSQTIGTIPLEQADRQSLAAKFMEMAQKLMMPPAQVAKEKPAKKTRPKAQPATKS